MGYATHRCTRLTATTRTWTGRKCYAYYHTRGGITSDWPGVSTASLQRRYEQRCSTHRGKGGKAGKRASCVDCITQSGTGGKGPGSCSATRGSPGGITTRQLQAST